MITEERKDLLQKLINYIQENIDLKKEVNLNFICTHNSRRSHLAQIWAQVAAWKYRLPMIHCYSGGTEVTALFPTTVEALKEDGLQVQKLSEGDNPIYAIKCDFSSSIVISFSKLVDHFLNPSKDFAAIMTCNNADKNCPYIPGAEIHCSLPYIDPKVHDGTKEEFTKYLERSRQIREEMSYLMSKIKV